MDPLPRDTTSEEDLEALRAFAQEGHDRGGGLHVEFRLRELDRQEESTESVRRIGRHVRANSHARIRACACVRMGVGRRREHGPIHLLGAPIRFPEGCGIVIYV